MTGEFFYVKFSFKRQRCGKGIVRGTAVSNQGIFRYGKAEQLAVFGGKQAQNYVFLCFFFADEKGRFVVLVYRDIRNSPLVEEGFLVFDNGPCFVFLSEGNNRNLRINFIAVRCIGFFQFIRSQR